MKYRIKQGAPRHYVGGQLYSQGDVVEYPDTMKPGAWLEPVEIVATVEQPKRRGRPPKVKQ